MLRKFPVKVINESISIFNRKERFQFIGFVFLQIAISTLDIIAVILSGALSLQVIQLINGNNSEIFLPTLDIFSETTSEKRLLFISILTFTFFVLRIFGSIFINRTILNYLSVKTAKVSQELLRGYFSLPLNKQNKYDSQATLYAISDGVDRAILGTLGTAIVISVDFISTIFLLGIMVIFFPSLALGVVLYFGFAILILNRYSSLRIAKYGNVKIESNIEIRKRFTSIQNSYRELFLSSKLSKEINMIGKMKNTSAGASADQILISNLNKYIFEAIIVFAFVIFLGFQSLVSNSMPNGSTIGIVGASILRLIPNILRLHQGSLEIAATSSEASKTFDLYRFISNENIEHFTNDGNYGEETKDGNIRVEFDLVEFSYDSRFNIHQLNFVFSAPKLVAVIGQNGAGKSTLLDLISGVIEPTSGSVRINSEIARKYVLNNPGAISYVPQDIHLFGTTLNENIHLESEFNDKSEKYSAVFNLNIDMNAKVSQLSGGQMQRLSLTRANLNNSFIILLDEPTSALDKKGELEFQSWLKELKSNKLIFIVAHRLDTIKQADSVICMENGRIEHIGDLESSEQYIRNMQASAQIF